MRRRVFLWMFPAAVVLCAQESEVRQIGTDDLKKLLEEQGDKLFLLDVREPKEIEELGTLKGHVNVPLGQIESRLAEIPKDREILVMCNRGVRAAKGAAVLQRNGYTKIAGATGLQEWKKRDWPLVYPKAESKQEESGKK